MDQDLVRRVQHGDEDAFAALAIADHTPLFRVAYGILRDRGRAEDATQASLLDIWRDIGELRHSTGLRPGRWSSTSSDPSPGDDCFRQAILAWERPATIRA